MDIFRKKGSVFSWQNLSFLFFYIITGKTATAEDANKTIGYIRSLVKKTWGAEVAKNLRIQYGGSMKPSNAKELMAMRNIDGGLIGGAALKAEDFAGIVNYKG